MVIEFNTSTMLQLRQVAEPCGASRLKSRLRERHSESIDGLRWGGFAEEYAGTLAPDGYAFGAPFAAPTKSDNWVHAWYGQK